MKKLQKVFKFLLKYIHFWKLIIQKFPSILPSIHPWWSFLNAEAHYKSFHWLNISDLFSRQSVKNKLRNQVQATLAKGMRFVNIIVYAIIIWIESIFLQVFWTDFHSIISVNLNLFKLVGFQNFSKIISKINITKTYSKQSYLALKPR
jgi:hypothetical protein